jgi:hypothetical protein
MKLSDQAGVEEHEKGFAMQERPSLPLEHVGQPPVATATGAARGQDLGLNDPRALQILSTEHWGLLATRSMLWNESFARAALFLSVLSASVVALSLIGTERPDFRTFALIVLPVTLFIGVATFMRTDDSNREEAVWLVAMNQIRNGYVTMVPGIADRFVTGLTDDFAGITRSYGRPPDVRYTFWHFFVTIPGMIAVVDGTIAGVIAAIALSPVGIPAVGLGVLAVAVGVGVTLVLGLRSKRGFDMMLASHQPRFPDLPSQTPHGH